jgi:hypothetical protein
MNELNGYKAMKGEQINVQSLLVIDPSVSAIFTIFSSLETTFETIADRIA